MASDADRAAVARILAAVPPGGPAPDICPECDMYLTASGWYTVDPTPFRGGDPQHVFCYTCGKAEHPENMTANWNAAEGCHLTCIRPRPTDIMVREFWARFIASKHPDEHTHTLDNGSMIYCTRTGAEEAEFTKGVTGTVYCGKR